MDSISTKNYCIISWFAEDGTFVKIFYKNNKAFLTIFKDRTNDHNRYSIDYEDGTKSVFFHDGGWFICRYEKNGDITIKDMN